MMRYTRLIQHAAIAMGVGLAITGCQTTGSGGDSDTDSEPIESVELEPIQAGYFIPNNFIARVHFEEGQYQNLLSPSSHAVWVDSHISDVKLAHEQRGNTPVSGVLVNAADVITNNYVVIECHVDTLFPDASIAYDVSGLRNLEVYLESDMGRRIYPLQKVLGSTAGEEQVGALRRFDRLNLLVFPMEDVITQQPTIEVGTQSMQLVVEGHSSRFTFTWLGQGPAGPMPTAAEEQTMADLIMWRPSDAEVYQVLKVRFTDLYEKLGALTRLPRG